MQPALLLLLFFFLIIRNKFQNFTDFNTMLCFDTFAQVAQIDLVSVLKQKFRKK